MVIKSQRQYRATRAQLTRLEENLDRAKAVETRLQPAVHEAMIAGLEAQIAELRQDLEEYDSLGLDRCETRLAKPGP